MSRQIGIVDEGCGVPDVEKSVIRGGHKGASDPKVIFSERHVIDSIVHDLLDKGEHPCPWA